MLAIFWHSRTGAARSLAEAVHRGAGNASRLIFAPDAGPQDLLDADGYVFACPENLGTMSGLMKDMFDRCYYPLLGRIEGRAYATVIAAGSDGQGAQAQIDRIVTGWRLRRGSPPLFGNPCARRPGEILSRKIVGGGAPGKYRELGQALAEGLSMGMF